MFVRYFSLECKYIQFVLWDFNNNINCSVLEYYYITCLSDSFGLVMFEFEAVYYDIFPAL